MLKIRCSALDRVLTCASSIPEPKTPYRPNSPEAKEGTAGHDALAQTMNALTVTGKPVDLEAIAAKHGVDVDVLAMFVKHGMRAWDEIKQWFEHPRTEFPMTTEVLPGLTLPGTADVISASPDAISVNDWKLGWSPTEHTAQLLGYAFNARATFGMPKSGYILGVESWVRVGEIRIHKFTSYELDELPKKIAVQVGQIGKDWGPSHDSCRFCPHQLTCSARAEWLRSGVLALVPSGEAATALTPQLMGELFERRKVLGQALDRYDDVLAAMLDAGPVPLPGGKHLEWQIQEQDKIIPSRAMPFLREDMELKPEEANQVINITKSGLERVIKARAAKGKGAEAMRAALKRLTELEAIEKQSKKLKKVVG